MINSPENTNKIKRLKTSKVNWLVDLASRFKDSPVFNVPIKINVLRNWSIIIPVLIKGCILIKTKGETAKKFNNTV